MLLFHPRRCALRASLIARCCPAVLCLGAMGSSCQNTPVPATISIPGEDASVSGTIDSHLKFFVPVTINGRGPYNFVVDTGAAITVVSSQLGNSLPADSGPTSSIVGVGGTTNNAKFVAIDSMGIGAMRFNDFRAVVIDISDSNGGVYAGIVGLPVFRNATVQLDYPGKALRVQSALLAANACNRPIEGADLYSNGVFTPASTTLSVAGRDATVVIDSGSESFLDLDNTFTNLPFTGPLTSGMAGGVSGSEPTQTGTLSGAAILGCLQWNNPRITFGQTKILGMGAAGWQTLVLLIDQRSKLMRLQQPDCPPNQDCINPNPTITCFSLDGTWSTTLGEMRFFDGASAGTVSGQFTQGSCGSFFGTTTQGAPGCPGCLTLTGHWTTQFSNDANCLPARRFAMDDTGPIEFVFSADFGSFTGKWAYYDANFDGQLDSEFQPWNGQHVTCN